MTTFRSLAGPPIGCGSNHGKSSITPHGDIHVRLLEASLEITAGPTVFGIALRHMLASSIASDFRCQQVIDLAVVTLHLMGPYPRARSRAAEAGEQSQQYQQPPAHLDLVLEESGGGTLRSRLCSPSLSLSDDNPDRRHVRPGGQCLFFAGRSSDRFKTGISHCRQSFTDRLFRSSAMKIVRVRTMWSQESSVKDSASGRFVTERFSGKSWIALSHRLVQNVAALHEPVFADKTRGVLLLRWRVSHRQDVGVSGDRSPSGPLPICQFRGFSCCSSNAVSTKP
jgi:hypothetical protein